MQSVGWNDGDIMTLADIVKEEIWKKCNKNNNIRCNQSVKLTGFDKMCDLAIIFNLLKQIEKQTTLKDIPFNYLYSVIGAIF